VGDGGRGVPKSTHDARETDHACHNEIYHRTEQTWPGKTETKEKTNCPLQKKNLNGGVAILLKKKSLLVNLITFLTFLILSGQQSRDACRIICHFKKT
jgi:hypothetical protein